MIEKGDIVQVNFYNAQVTLSHAARVEHIPQATGDSWIFFDMNTLQEHYVSEGCTVSLLRKGKQEQGE